MLSELLTGKVAIAMIVVVVITALMKIVMIARDVLRAVKILKWMEHVKLILECARKVEDNRNNLHNTYIDWLRISEETITTATKIREEIMDNNCTNNDVRVRSATRRIAGTISSILGVFSSISSREGSLCGRRATTGAVVSVGSSIKRKAATENLCKQAVKNFKANKRHTASLQEELERYYDAVDEFDSIFKTIKGNDVALPLFNEFADEEGFGLLEDLTRDRQSRNEVCKALRKIITSKVKNVVPRMRFLEFLRYADRQTQNVEERIRNMLAALRNYIENDPELRRIFRDKLRIFLDETLRDGHRLEIRKLIEILPPSMVGPVAMNGYLNIKMSLKKMSETVCCCLIALNAIFLAMGLYDLTKVGVNLEDGSQSNESKSITEVIDDLKKNREDVTDQMKTNFRW